MMVKVFQKMLEEFGLTEKILSFNADNASSNNTQTTKLDELDNSFNKENCARCFNHTLQLLAKTLLKPFNSGLSGKATEDDEMAITEEIEDPDGLLMPENEGEGEDEDEDEDEATDHDKEEDEDDGIDELAELGEDEQTRLLEDTAAVCQAVTKVRINDGIKIVRILTNFISRSDNSHSHSSIQQLSLFQPGITIAMSSTSKSASSPMML